MISEATDVFVVGGGPAGLAAAIAARQKGFTVSLADGREPPIDKPCGEGLMPGTLRALAALGVRLDARVGHRLRGMRFVQAGACVTSVFPDGEGIGIRRPLLHETLLARAKGTGVRLFWRAPVTGIAPEGVEIAGRLVRTRWIIAADGSGSRVRRWSGLGAATHQAGRAAVRRHYRVRPWSDHVEIHWVRRIQAYVTPISGEEICVVTTGESPGAASFRTVLESLPDLRAKLVGAPLATRERGAVTWMTRLRRVSRGNVALVGDASGGVDAITGEGLCLAFRQALALADAIAAGDLREYERAHRILARRPMRMGRMLLTMSRNPAVRERLVRALAARPELFERLLAMHAGQAQPDQILATGARLGWQFLAA